ncbi:hypothetical protein D3C77_648830 [compost metagenome]
MVEKLEQGLQLVVAVGTAPVDMQEQVELGRGGQGQLGVVHGGHVRCAGGWRTRVVQAGISAPVDGVAIP